VGWPSFGRGGTQKDIGAPSGPYAPGVSRHLRHSVSAKLRSSAVCMTKRKDAPGTTGMFPLRAITSQKPRAGRRLLQLS